VAVIVTGLSVTEGVMILAAIIAVRGIDVFVTKRWFERSEAAWEMRQYFYEGEDQRGQ
jgi:hypothetical protein